MVLSAMERYVKGEALGEGTFGVVFQAHDKLSDKIVAIKKIRLGKAKEGVNVTALREIKLLQELKHPNIIPLLDVFPHKHNLHLARAHRSIVFEYMETDLEAVIKAKKLHLGPADVKSYLLMVLRAMEHCHRNWVLHRDLKPNNLLIAADGVLKLADFGLAKIFGSPERKLTNQVFARWYRAPELLFGSKCYGAGVDMWAVGCIFGELVLRAPLFEGSSDIDQLGKIFAALGTPSDVQWPGMRFLPDYVQYVPCPAPPLRARFPSASDDAISLLQGLLTYDPNKRLTAAGALAHPYFSSAPPPTPPSALPRPRRALAHPAGAAAAEAAGMALGDQQGPGQAPGAQQGPQQGRSSPGTIRALAQQRRSFPPAAVVEGAGAGVHHPNATQPRVGAQQAQEQRDAEMSLGGTPGSLAAGLASGGEHGEGDAARPALAATDQQWVRKRKLALDQALEQASQGE